MIAIASNTFAVSRLKNEVFPNGLINLSLVLFTISLTIRYCAIVSHQAIPNAPAEMKKQENEMTAMLAASRGGKDE
jgi:hypothetical protein